MRIREIGEAPARPHTAAAASRPCGAEAPGGRGPSPAPAGEPATTAGAGTAPPPAHCRPVPPATARRRPPHVVVHRAVGDAERRGNLAVAAPEIVLQAQKLSHLAHGQPSLRHPLAPRLGPGRGWKKASLQLVFQRSYSLTRGRSVCAGIGDRHEMESLIGMRRNQQLHSQPLPAHHGRVGRRPSRPTRQGLPWSPSPAPPRRAQRPLPT